jgi:hypothetical protein
MPMGFDPTAQREVRYLPVMSRRRGKGDDSLVELSVHCPRRGKTSLEDCMECSHAGRLRHHGRRGPLVLECNLERHWQRGRT